MITRRRCCPTARCLSQAVTTTQRLLASAELYDPASGTWSGHRQSRHRALSHTATLLPNGKVLVAGGLPYAFSPARNSTIRRAGLGRRPAASSPDAIFTRRRCCPTARCLSQAALTQLRRILRPRNSTIRRPAPGRRPAASATGTGCHTATLLPNGKVLVAGGRDCHDPSRSRQRGTLRSGQRYLDRHRQPRHRTLISHGDVAAQRQGARRRRFDARRRSRERGTL